MKYSYLILFSYLFSSITFSCSEKERGYQRVGFAFDTVCSIQIFTNQDARRANEILDKAFERLSSLELIFSPTLKESEVSKFNESPKGMPVELSDELLYIIEENLRMAKETNGAFNPCLGKLTKLWRPLWQKTSEDERLYALPSEKDIASALECVNYKSIFLQEKVATKMQDMELDLGASAKGYATDCVKDILLNEGIDRAVIDLGGNVAVLHKKENGSLWKVGIKMPIPNSYGKVAGYLETFDTAIVTSGNYERFVEINGKVYHHIISPQTGKPVDNEIKAVTIIAPNAMLADILSTACFVLGRDKGSTLLKKFPNILAIFFLKDDLIMEVNGDKEFFNVVDNSLRKLKN